MSLRSGGGGELRGFVLSTPREGGKRERGVLMCVCLCVAQIFPLHRLNAASRPAGPGVEIRERSGNKTDGFPGAVGLEDLASLE